MATVNYLFKGKKNPANLYCRFTNTRSVDLWATTNIFLNPEYWDQGNQKIRNVIVVKNRDEINKKLTQLKIHIIDCFNIDFMNGEIIDKDWLKKTITLFFKRPNTEINNFNKPSTIYYTDYTQNWLDVKSKSWLIGSDKYMPKREIMKYERFLFLVREFEGKKKIKLKEINDTVITDFVKFLNKEDYSSKTIKRHIGRFKFFCLRAKEDNLQIDNSYSKKVFLPTIEEIKEPYFNPKEIESIFKYDFSNNDSLDNVRDNLIIAVWTGLRVSDFLGGLNISNFIDDFIEITNQKTKTSVTIPIHPMVKKILIKRNGKLPRKISDVKFNKYVKIVCEKVGLNSTMKGSLYDKDKKRRVVDMYKKYELVSSHIGRRSMATNHYGKVPNQTIMKICGWSTEGMMLKYIKKSNKSYAVELQKYWETQTY